MRMTGHRHSHKPKVVNAGVLEVSHLVTLTIEVPSFSASPVSAGSGDLPHGLAGSLRWCDKVAIKKKCILDLELTRATMWPYAPRCG